MKPRKIKSQMKHKNSDTLNFVQDFDRNDLRLITTGDLMEITGKTRVTIYSWMKRGILPEPVRITATTRGWFPSQLMDWKEQLIAQAAKNQEIRQEQLAAAE